MNKQQALSRLSSLENEAKELRRIIEEENKGWEIVEISNAGFIYSPYESYMPKGCKIHSVRRLSDGETYSFNEEVNSTWGYQTITGFLVNGDEMIVEFKTCRNPLSRIRKLPKRTALFTTEDGLDVFEGGTFWYKGDDWTAKETIIFNGEIWNKKLPCFSTKEKCEEYILLNKPCLSVKEVKDVIGIYHEKSVVNTLIEIAKSKM